VNNMKKRIIMFFLTLVFVLIFNIPLLADGAGRPPEPGPLPRPPIGMNSAPIEMPTNLDFQ